MYVINWNTEQRKNKYIDATPGNQYRPPGEAEWSIHTVSTQVYTPRKQAGRLPGEHKERMDTDTEWTDVHSFPENRQTHMERSGLHSKERHAERSGKDVGSRCLTSLLFLSRKAMAAGLTIWSFISWG